MCLRVVPEAPQQSSPLLQQLDIKSEAMTAPPSRSGVYVAAAAPAGGRGGLHNDAPQLPRLEVAEAEQCLPACTASTERESAAIAVCGACLIAVLRARAALPDALHIVCGAVCA